MYNKGLNIFIALKKAFISCCEVDIICMYNVILLNLTQRIVSPGEGHPSFAEPWQYDLLQTCIQTAYLSSSLVLLKVR